MKITPGNATPNIVCILYCVFLDSDYSDGDEIDEEEGKESCIAHSARAREVAEVGPCLILISSGPEDL